MSESIERELSELRSSMAEMRSEVRAAWKRIDEQQMLNEAVHRLALSVRDATSECKQTHTDYTNLRNIVEEIRSRPAKRWESVFAAFITGSVGILLGLLFRNGGL